MIGGSWSPSTASSCSTATGPCPRSSNPCGIELTDARRVVVVRALRGFADGFVSVLLADHLLDLGYSPFRVGVVVTATLVGSAVLTLLVGLTGHRLGFRVLLLGASALMLATGIGFLAVE